MSESSDRKRNCGGAEDGGNGKARKGAELFLLRRVLRSAGGDEAGVCAKRAAARCGEADAGAVRCAGAEAKHDSANCGAGGGGSGARQKYFALESDTERELASCGLGAPAEHRDRLRRKDSGDSGTHRAVSSV